MNTVKTEFGKKPFFSSKFDPATSITFQDPKLPTDFGLALKMHLKKMQIQDAIKKNCAFGSVAPKRKAKNPSRIDYHRPKSGPNPNVLE